MAYQGTIEVYATRGPTRRYEKLDSLSDTLRADLVDVKDVDFVLNKVLKHVKESLSEYENIITEFMTYGVDIDEIRGINSNINYSEINNSEITFDPITISRKGKYEKFTYIVSFGELIFEEDSERTYNNRRNRSHHRSKSRSRSKRRSRNTRRKSRK